MGIVRATAGCVGSGLGFIAETSQAVCIQAFTFDRSEQTLADNLEAQIRGRAREILWSLIAASVSAIFVAYGVASIMKDPSVISYLAMGASGISMVLSIKEAVLQCIAREKEKNLFLEELREKAKQGTLAPPNQPPH